MKQLVRSILLFLNLLVVISVKSQKEDDSNYCECTKTDNVLEMKLNLEDLYSGTSTKSSYIFRSLKDTDGEKIRIDKNTSVTLKFRKPNLFRYDFKFEDEKKLIESYNYLDGLLEKAFKLAGGGAQSDSKLKEWDTEIIELTNSYNELIEMVPEEVFLIQLQVDDMAGAIDNILNMLKENSDLNKAKREAKDYLETLGAEVTPIQLEYYRELKEKETSIISAIKKFVGIFDRVKVGIAHNVSKQKAGTVVTIRIKPEINNTIFLNDSVDNPKEVTIQYFVQSRFKVHFHTGISFTGIKEISVEKLTEGETDAFKIVESKDNSTDLVAFLSIPLVSINELGTSGVDFSLGTGYNDVGEKIFLGLSYRLSNIGSITGGAVLDTKSIDVEGDGNIGDLVDDFEIKNVFGGFFSISINAF